MKQPREIRRKRATALYMKLKHIIETENLKNWEKLKIIFSSIEQNSTTTELRHINTALKINEENILYGELNEA